MKSVACYSMIYHQDCVTRDTPTCFSYLVDSL